MGIKKSSKIKGKDKRKFPCPKCDSGELYDDGGMFMATYLCSNPKCDYRDGTSDRFSGLITTE